MKANGFLHARLEIWCADGTVFQLFPPTTVQKNPVGKIKLVWFALGKKSLPDDKGEAIDENL